MCKHRLSRRTKRDRIGPDPTRICQDIPESPSNDSLYFSFLRREMVSNSVEGHPLPLPAVSDAHSLGER